MTDVAALGLSVDSKQVEKARDELGRFAGAAKSAETAAKGFEAGAARVGAASEKMSKQMAAAINSAQQINQRLNVKSDFGGTQRAADVAAYGNELDNLRARFVPLYAAERAHKTAIDEISQAAKVGAISEVERANAVRMAEVAYVRTTTAMKANASALKVTGQQAALSSYAMTNLAFQVNDVATMAAMGADPMRILASQAGQFYQILSTGEGGSRGSLTYLRDLLVGMVTPARAVGVALAAVGGTAAVSFNSALNATREIEIGLSGIGRASGTTVEQIRQIALAAAESGDATVGSARTMALVYANLGKINADVTAKAVGLGKQLAATFGEDATEAAGRLAKALADPGRGIEDLNKRLGVYDARTINLVKSLTAQNRISEAQKLIMDGLEDGLVSAANATSVWERNWSKLTQTMSIGWEKIGHNIERAGGGGSITERYLTEVDKLRSIENRNPFLSWMIGLETVEQQYKKVADIQKEMLAEQGRSANADLTLRSKQLDDLARSISPAASELQKLRDQWTALARDIDSPGMAGKLGEDGLATARKALAMQEQRILFFKSSLDLAKEEAQFATEAANARSASQRADVEYQQTRSRLLREGDPDAQEKAQLVSRRIMAEAAAEQDRYARSRSIADEENLGRSRIELALVGQTAVTAAGLRAQFDAMAEAKRRANDLGELINDGDIKRAQQLRAEAEGATAALIRARAEQELSFERSQMGRSEREQNVYGRLQGMGVLTDGAIVGAQAEIIAQQVRFNEVMRLSQDMSKDFSTGFVKGMIDGQTASEALANSLNRLASKFADLAMDQAFSALFAPISKGVAAGATSGLFAGIFHEGGRIGDSAPQRYVPASVFAGAKRYHQGGVIGADEVPIIAQRGETMLPRGAKTGPNITIDARTTIDARGASEDAIRLLREEMALRDASFKQQVISVVQDAAERRMI